MGSPRPRTCSSPTAAVWPSAREHLGPLARDRVGLAVLSVDDLLDALGLDPRRRLGWYGGRVADRRASGAEHRRRKATLRPLLGDPRWLAGRPGGAEVLGHLAERRAALAPVAERLAAMSAAGRLQGRGLEELAGSFVHLHCNRLLGPDPAAERLVLGLARGPGRASTGRRSPRPPERPSGAGAGVAEDAGDLVLAALGGVGQGRDPLAVGQVGVGAGVHQEAHHSVWRRPPSPRMIASSSAVQPRRLTWSTSIPRSAAARRTISRAHGRRRGSGRCRCSCPWRRTSAPRARVARSSSR